MICPNCKSEMPDDATFCTKCWNVVPAPVEPVKKEKVEEVIKKYVSVAGIPLILKIDTHLSLDKTQTNAVEALKEKVKEAEMRFGEGAGGFKAYLISGIAAFISKHYEEAVEHFNSAIKLEPERKEGHHNKGTALYYLGKYGEAVECFEKSIKIDPMHAIGWYSKAMALIYSNRLHEGLKCYEKAVEIEPDLKKTRFPFKR
ncbi:MAG: tetratricopeptide repeat protein [Thermoplasmatales archaeon]|nr:tetratricopeptide repeat protein [Thermoplasmatales archaeon]